MSCTAHSLIHSFTHSLVCTLEQCILLPESPKVSAPLKCMWRGEEGNRLPPSPGLLVPPGQGGSCSQTFGSHYKHLCLILISPVRSLKQQIPGNFGLVPWQRETQRNGRELSPLTPATHGPHFGESGTMDSQPRRVWGRADTRGTWGSAQRWLLPGGVTPVWPQFPDL